MPINIYQNINKHEQEYIPKSFFFNNRWLNVIEKSFGLKRFYFSFKTKNLNITLPFFMVNFFFKKIYSCLPFSFNVSLKQDEEKNILNEISNFKSGNEIQIKSNFSNYTNYNIDQFKTKYNYYIVKLENNFEKKFSNNIKRNLKKNTNLEFKFVKNVFSKEFNDFYNSYVVSSKKLETFFYPKKFFFYLFEECCDDFYILTAYQNSKYVGGHLILLDSTNLEAIYFCASKSEDGKYIGIDKYLLNYSMNYCYKKKFIDFNLGRVNKENIGLNNFKLQFGSQIKYLNYFSMNKKNYAILDKNSLIKFLVKLLIRNTSLKNYTRLNNILFRYLSIY